MPVPHSTKRIYSNLFPGQVLQGTSAIKLIAFAAVLCVQPENQAQSTETAHRPNIVLILADDLGAHDVGCYRADLHETPNVDELARRGIKFLRAYSPSPVCTPTRAALLTGKHPARLRMTIWSEGSLRGPTDKPLIEAQSRHDLPHAETTLAERLQAAGYLTAIVGKWHLGDANHAPETQGFDVNIGGTHWGAPQTHFWPYRGAGRFGGEYRYVPHLEFGRPDEYLTDRLTDEALRVVDQSAKSKQPFFLLLAHHAPHTPIEAKSSDVERFQGKLQPGGNHQNPVYAAMVKSLDDSVGRVVARLKSQGLEDKTLVIFTSDNGGYIGTDARQKVAVTSNAPLRSGKGTLYEGGIRVPLIVSSPRMTTAGEECLEPVVLTDLFASIARAAGLAAAETDPTDGIDLTPLLTDPKAKLNREELLFHYPHYYHAPRSTPASAIRTRDWKLIEYFEDSRVELFNLTNDPAEQHDLATSQPEKASALRMRLHAWRNEVNAATPTANPSFKASHR